MGKKPMKPGRPPKYKTPEEMQSIINAYFKECEEGDKVTIIRKGLPITITKRKPRLIVGLARRFGFKSRQSLYDYIKRNQHGDLQEKEEFAYILTQAMMQCEEDTITGAMMGDYEPKISGLVAGGYGYSQKNDVEATVMSHEERLRKREEELKKQGF